MNKYYVGLELPTALRSQLVECQLHILGLLSPTTRVIKPHEFHITTLFLGKVPLGAAMEAVDIPWAYGPVHFVFNGLEVFDVGRGPHALVLKLKDKFGNAQMLKTAVIAAAPQINVGRTYPYNPHLTLAKCEGAPDVGLASAALRLQQELPHHLVKHEFVCEHLCLFEKAEGATEYSAIRVVSLK